MELLHQSERNRAETENVDSKNNFAGKKELAVLVFQNKVNFKVWRLLFCHDLSIQPHMFEPESDPEREENDDYKLSEARLQMLKVLWSAPTPSQAPVKKAHRRCVQSPFLNSATALHPRRPPACLLSNQVPLSRPSLSEVFQDVDAPSHVKP
ncbi:hypothetical protein AMECASPLE_036712 [Ameca splendens]|uniref:Uncharacterized protein n=1 Tax=Ameca splendens TaxID=208324 RepID=A0ABV0YVA6_9TELE